jgi:hypothetical protein
MKINEVTLKEGIWDHVKNAVYGAAGDTTSKGATSAMSGAQRSVFINKFLGIVAAQVKSAKASGMPLNMNNLVNSYLMKNKWAILDPAQKTYITQLVSASQGGTNTKVINQLANAMFQVGAEQVRDKQGNLLKPYEGGAQINANEPAAEPAAPAQAAQAQPTTQAPAQAPSQIPATTKLPQATVGQGAYSRQQPTAYPQKPTASEPTTPGANAFSQMANQLSNTTKPAPATAKPTMVLPQATVGQGAYSRQTGGQPVTQPTIAPAAPRAVRRPPLNRNSVNQARAVRPAATSKIR